MGEVRSEQQEKADFLSAAEEMYEELQQWRDRHAAASFDEIAAQVTPKRRALMGQLLGQLAQQTNREASVDAPMCEACGEVMEDKGERRRTAGHKEGESRLKRRYYYCARCEAGVFPPGSAPWVGGA